MDQVSGNNGIWGGTPAYAAGEVGQAFSFNSTFVRVPDAPSLHFSTGMTAEAWVKPTSYNSYGTILSKADAVSVYQTSFALAYGSGGVPYFYIENTNVTGAQANGPSALPLNQWTHVAGTYDGSLVKLYINGVLVSSNTLIGKIFPGTDDLGIGDNVGGNPNGQSISMFLGMIDEPTLYNRALTASEISAIYGAGAGGKCAGMFAPTISSQPQNQSIGESSSVTFSVGAGGTAPFFYQWNENGSAITGATNASLTLSNVSMALSGAVFSAVVSNTVGSVTSSNALLTVVPPPAALLIPNQTATSGVVVVPVTLVAQGNENTVAFSVNFNTNYLTFGGVQLDADDQNATMFVNTNQASTGLIGLAVSQSTGAAFPAGSNILADVTFIVIPTTNANTTQITFGDSPISRQVYDSSANTLAAVYTNGTLTIPYLGFEGDVYPVPNGDGKVLFNDWVEMGRIVAGIDVVTNASEFQRADCAPRSTLGDGQLTVSDWIQVGRYAAGLDPLTVAGGPTQPTGGTPSVALKKSSHLNSSALVSSRNLSVTTTTVQAGQNCQLSVTLAAQGNESGVEFSLVFPSNVFTYVSAALGSNASGASLMLNTNDVASGKLGVVLALPSSTFPAANLEVLKLTLQSAPISAGSNTVAFYSQPLPEEISDTTATPVASAYFPGAVVITPVTRPALSMNGNSLSRFSFAYPASASGFVLESTSSLNPPRWTNAVAALVTNGNNIVVTGPTNNPSIFYRLRSP